MSEQSLTPSSVFCVVVQRRDPDCRKHTAAHRVASSSLTGEQDFARHRAQGRNWAVKGPAWAKVLGRRPALSAFFLSEVQILLTQSIKWSLKLTQNNNPEHLLNTGSWICTRKVAESNLFHTVWPQECVDSFSVEHSKYFSFTVKSGMFGNGLC